MKKILSSAIMIFILLSDSWIGGGTAFAEKSNSKSKLDKPVVVYKGFPVDGSNYKIDIFNSNSSDSDEAKELYKKYNTTYKIYNDGKYLGKSFGKIAIRGMDADWYIQYDKDYVTKTETQNEIGVISDTYNPYPRKVSYKNNNFPGELNVNGKVVKTINKQFKVKATVTEINSVDLDHDGKTEYLILAVDKKNNFFTIALLSAKYDVISYISVIKDTVEPFLKIDYARIFKGLSLSNLTEIVDADGDGVMEILIDRPSYEGVIYSTLKYSRGKINCNFIEYDSFKP